MAVTPIFPTAIATAAALLEIVILINPVRNLALNTATQAIAKVEVVMVVAALVFLGLWKALKRIRIWATVRN